MERLPLWVPPLVYLVLTVLLFREFVFSDLMLFGSDTLSLGYMARDFYAEALRTTGFPLWNPLILGGTPFLESLAGGDSLHPISVSLLLLLDTHRALGWKLVLHVFLAGVGMFAWLRVVGVSRGASLVGGTAFLLAPYMVTLVFPGHDGKLFVTAMTPFAFWATEWFLRRGGLLPLAALAGVVATVILSTHFQMAYFLFGGVGAYAIFRCVQGARGEWGWRRAGSRFAAFLLFSVLGAGITSVQLIPAVDYVTEHSRRAATTLQVEGEEGVTYSSSWSLHPEELVSLAVPEFVGANVGTEDWTSDTYWGRNPFKLNHEYLGIVVLLLAGLAFTGGPGVGLRWFMAGLGGVVILFTLGTHTPVWRVLYELLPGISLFRAPSMAVFLAGFAATTLAALGIDRAARLVDEGRLGIVLKVLGGGTAVLVVGLVLAATGGLSALWTAIVYSDIDASAQAALETLQPHLVRGFGLSALLGGLLAALWWAVGHGWFPAALLVPALVLLPAGDQWRVDAAFIEVMDHRSFTAPDQNHRFLMERADEEDPFRVLSLERRGQDVRPAMYGLELAAGHHPNDLWRYRELIGMEGSGVPEHLARFHPNVLDVLNVRYVLWPEAQYGPLEGAQPASQVTAGGRVVSTVYRVETLPRARVVGDALVVGEEESVATVLDLERYDPSRQVVLTEPPPVEPGGEGVRGSAEWIERTPDRLVLDVESSGPAILVVSENWFPAWRARVDGEETPVLRADHTLRAVSVPQGRHRVEFRYEALLLRAGFGLSLLCLLLVAGAAMVEPIQARFRNRAAREGERGRGDRTGDSAG